MTINVRVAGVWKTVTTPYVRVSGVWKEITAGYVRVAGVWKEFFLNALQPTLTRGSTAIKTVTYTGYSDGNTPPHVGTSFGALGSPNTLDGDLIAAIWTNNSGGGQLQVLIDGSHSQNAFSSIDLSIGSFTTASADTYQVFGSPKVYTQWLWNGVTPLASSGSEVISINL